MRQQRPHGTAQGSSIRRVGFASLVGTAIEWYDFIVYGTAAALVFPRLFFPSLTPLAGTLASFATFGVAFFARPIGGVVFGHFGDRVGRKSMLVVTLLLMGGATFLVGLMPTFDQVGILAPLLLVVLRFIQGFAVGGEWGGAILMTVEHAPENRRNFYASWPQLGVPIGLMLSTGVFAAFSFLPNSQFFAWGWRAPFLLSFVLIAVGLFIRLRVTESPAFSRVKGLRLESRLPLFEVLRNYPRPLLLAIGIVLFSIGGSYIITTFALSYLTEQLGVARGVALSGQLFVAAAEGVSILLFARLADRFGKRPIAIGSAVGSLLLAFPFFWLLDTRSPALIWLAMFSIAFVTYALYGISGALLAELFETRLRYSGISVGYQMAGMLSGAAPFVATALVHWSGGASWPVATYLAVMALITLVAVYLVTDRYRVAIHEPMPARSSPIDALE